MGKTESPQGKKSRRRSAAAASAAGRIGAGKVTIEARPKRGGHAFRKRKAIPSG